MKLYQTSSYGLIALLISAGCSDREVPTSTDTPQNEGTAKKTPCQTQGGPKEEPEKEETAEDTPSPKSIVEDPSKPVVKSASELASELRYPCKVDKVLTAEKGNPNLPRAIAMTRFDDVADSHYGADYEKERTELLAVQTSLVNERNDKSSIVEAIHRKGKIEDRRISAEKSLDDAERELETAEESTPSKGAIEAAQKRVQEEKEILAGIEKDEQFLLDFDQIEMSILWIDERLARRAKREKGTPVPAPMRSEDNTNPQPAEGEVNPMVGPPLFEMADVPNNDADIQPADVGEDEEPASSGANNGNLGNLWEILFPGFVAPF